MAKTENTGKQDMKMPIINPHAAGIDIGSRFHVVSIGQGEDDVKTFGVFTEDLEQLCAYLKHNGIETIAMESTGYYWKPLFVLLQNEGFEVLLVNAKHVKDSKGVKSDPHDSRRIQKLHSLGLLTASYQPDEEVEVLRSYCRQRRYLVVEKSRHVNRMYKCLTMMNIQLGTVLSDLDSQSGLAIVEAILKGQRDATKLAQLVHPRVKASQETIIRSLKGTWRKECLFELRQCMELYAEYEKRIKAVDQEIETLLQDHVASKNDGEIPQLPEGKKTMVKKKSKNDPGFNMGRWSMLLTNGVDLLAIPGMGHGGLLTILSEVGWDLGNKFESAKHFTSWLGLSPNVRKSGGKVLSSKTKKNKSITAQAFRHAANSVGNMNQHPLNSFFKRIALKKDRLAAIVATARKLAVIFYNMIVKGEDFNYVSDTEYEERMRKNQLQKIKKLILKFDIKAQDLELAL
jgi:transposase